MIIDPYRFQTVAIAAVVRESPAAVSVKLTPQTHYAFVSGQHAVVRVDVNGVKLLRQYSFSSAPSSNEIWLTIVKTPGGAVSSWFVDEAKVGDSLDISHPFTGPLMQKTTRGKICMIAGGSGIAPLMSLLRENRLAPQPSPVSLLYSTRRQQICFSDELIALPHETLQLQISDEDGKFTPDGLRAALQNTSEIYICGSRPFVTQVAASCRSQQPTTPIYSEAFSL